MEINDQLIPENMYNNWQKIVNLMAELIDVPVALIMRVNSPQVEVFNTSESPENPFKLSEKYRLEGLYCEEVINNKRKLLVPNVLKDSRWEDNPDLEYDMISYLGFPIMKPDGGVFGTICVKDRQERDYSKKCKKIIKEFKEMVENQLENIYLKDELEKIKDLTQSALDSLTTNIVILDREGCIKYVNRAWNEFAKNNDLDPEEVGTGTNYLKVCKEAESEWSKEASRAYEGIKEVMKGNKNEFSLEYPCHSPDEKRWFSMKVTPFVGKEAYSVVLEHKNITDEKLAEKALKESEKKFRRFVENANDIIYTLSPNGIFTYVSPNWTDLIGHDPTEVVGQSFESFVHPEDIDKCKDFLQKVIATGKKASGVEYRVKSKDGNWRWHTTNGSIIRDEEEETVSFLGVAHDITERKKERERIEYLSFHDEITGLYNRRYFENEIKRLNNSRKLPISIIIGDMDRLKYINDNYGHKMGDKFIEEAAEIFKTVTRQEDIVARIGGDEFAIMLPEADFNIAQKICKRIQAKIKQHNKKKELFEPLKLSLGYAVKEDKEQDLNKIFNKADQKMYEKKKRNRCS